MVPTKLETTFMFIARDFSHMLPPLNPTPSPPIFEKNDWKCSYKHFIPYFGKIDLNYSSGNN